jgi:hypothetical protein
MYVQYGFLCMILPWHKLQSMPLNQREYYRQRVVCRESVTEYVCSSGSGVLCEQNSWE